MTEKAYFPSMGLYNDGNLPGQTEKIAMNKKVIGREKEPEAGVGMKPADNDLLRIKHIHQLLNGLPGIGGEGEGRGPLYHMIARDSGVDMHPAIRARADEESATFNGDPFGMQHHPVNGALLISERDPDVPASCQTSVGAHVHGLALVRD
jgi:hypothetical protein